MNEEDRVSIGCVLWLGLIMLTIGAVWMYGAIAITIEGIILLVISVSLIWVSVKENP